MHWNPQFGLNRNIAFTTLLTQTRSYKITLQIITHESLLLRLIKNCWEPNFHSCLIKEQLKYVALSLTNTHTFCLNTSLGQITQIITTQRSSQLDKQNYRNWNKHLRSYNVGIFIICLDFSLISEHCSSSGGIMHECIWWSFRDLYSSRWMLFQFWRRDRRNGLLTFWCFHGTAWYQTAGCTKAVGGDGSKSER